MMINGGKRSKHNPEGPSSSKNIKQPRRGEANYLPNLPDRHDESSLENARKVVIEETKKKRPNASLVSRIMEETFSLRRREIVTQEPAVQSMMERWPALFTERQVRYLFVLACLTPYRFQQTKIIMIMIFAIIEQLYFILVSHVKLFHLL